MINKIIHFSDLHLRTNKDHDLYRDIIENVLSDWRELSPDRIVFTGDFIHQKNQISPEQISFMAWMLTECSEIAKTIIILGNHDFLDNNRDRLDLMSVILELMDNNNLGFYPRKGVYRDENVNWCVFSLMDDNFYPGYGEEGLNIGLFHGKIAGLSTDLGFNFEEGYNPENFINMDLMLCGDIHKRQTFSIPNNNIGYMVGSLIQQDKGERISKHGYGVYYVENNKYEFVDVFNPRPFIKFSIKSIEDIENESEILINY